MKVALINNTFLIKGGTERHIIDAAELLKSVGIETVFVNSQTEHATVETYSFPELFSLKFFDKKRREKAMHEFEVFLMEQKVDLVHLVHIDNPYLIRFLSKRWPVVRTIHTAYIFCLGGTRYLPRSQKVCLKRCGMQCFITHQAEGCIRYGNKQPLLLKHQLKKLWIVKANQNADLNLHRIGVTSRFMKDLLLQHGYNAEKIDIMPPPLPSILEASNENSFSFDKAPSIVFSGRLIPEKGVLDLIKALSLIKTTAKLLIAGDGPEKPRLEEEARKLGVYERVKFMGWLPHSESQNIYRRGWVTVFPSHWPEPFGFSGIESFLNNRPVIAYNVGGVSEWLVDGKNGFLVEPCNISQLAEKIDYMLQSPDRCKEMGTWGNQYVRKNFSQDKHLELKTSFYEKAMESFYKQKHCLKRGCCS